MYDRLVRVYDTRSRGETIGSGGDFAFPDTHFVNALLAMLFALRLVAGS